ncbi:glutamine amidotransferase [Blastococcus haudaquaticus]|uniref:Uncharacterized membrane protein n=1 Tax=Blastococcus haudaquaticus TaxID=1938745 RepID=A0A286H125_9ACTN|nr:glutamine amidotransferase [Blastococcus haudaquaticus]SOE01490.1 Uncharacterized membrane protein [Blastococcus haudaquaticus]
MTRALLAGESWSVTSIHTKGFDSFTTVDYAEGGQALIAALEDGGIDLTYMPSHVAATHFPTTREQLDAYDVVLLSDIGANTLLLPSRTFVRGQASPNRLALLRDWVRDGGGLAMVGGYLSFQGIEAKANYRSGALAEVLPVVMETGDDREETPQGVRARLVGTHPVTDGLDAETPALLGYQRLVPKDDAQTVAAFDDHPLLVLGVAGAGRTLAYASDIGPHWAPEEFTSWPGFARLWQQAVRWLAGEGQAR